MLTTNGRRTIFKKEKKRKKEKQNPNVAHCSEFPSFVFYLLD
jgi:hypothetical protein